MTNEHHTHALRLSKTKAHQRQLKVREAYHSYQLSQHCKDRTSSWTPIDLKSSYHLKINELSEFQSMDVHDLCDALVSFTYNLGSAHYNAQLYAASLIAKITIMFRLS